MAKIVFFDPQGIGDYDEWKLTNGGNRMARQLSRRRSEPVNPDPVDDDDDYDPTPDDSKDIGNYRRSSRADSTTRRRSSSEDSGVSRHRREAAPDPDDDDDDSPPRRGHVERKRQASPPARAAAGRGWEAYKKAKSKASKFNDEDKLSVDEGDEELISFLDDAPFCTWNEHFIRELDGKKSWTCLDDDCPLCERGDSPGYRAAFNVAVFDKDGNPSVKYWIATPGPLEEIEKHAFNDRYGPLNKDGNYFVVSKKKGKNKFFKYTVERVTAAQVADEFGFEPLTDDDLAELAEGAFEEKDVLQVSSRKELRDVAKELDD